MGQSRELAFAIDVCRRAGELALRHFERGVSLEMKSDGTPVTAADKECEQLIRRSIADRFPDDDILGEEEGGSVEPRSRRKWIIDPIDGTYNYARGIPIFSTLLALEQDGDIVLGIVHAPAFGDTFWAETGAGAYKNGERIRVSDISDLSRAQFNFGAPGRILELGYWEGFGRVIAGTYRQRGFGDYLTFAYVFEGKAEAALEVGVSPWDIAPMKILAVEAGGAYSDLEGGGSVYKGSCLVSNPAVHEPILRLLAGNNPESGHK